MAMRLAYRDRRKLRECDAFALPVRSLRVADPHASHYYTPRLARAAPRFLLVNHILPLLPYLA